MSTTKKAIPTGIKSLSNSISEIDAAGSYLIDKRIEMKGDFKLPYGVTLYFEGGYIIGNGKLTGNHTRIVAPIEQIFYDAVFADDAEPAVPVNNRTDDNNEPSIAPGDTIEEYIPQIVPAGTWDIEVAYPHWFGMKTFKELWEGEYYFGITDFSKYDCAPAINKAINMKRCGKVFIPKGRYVIDSTIYVEPGIDLVGEARSNGTTLHLNIEEDLDYGTYFYTMKGAKYSTGYVIEFNTKNAHFTNYISQGSTIRNLAFVVKDSGNRNQKCIYTRGGFELNNCIWDGFAQALKVSSDYNDLKKIANCTFNNSPAISENTDEWLYAFDLSGLGDALVFERNAVHNNEYHKALKISDCGGGVISANILNADVFIENSKGIVYEANHMEYGANIKIKSSTVSLLNNYIYKGERPSITFDSSYDGDSSVVQMIGNLFLCSQSNATELVPDISKISPYELEFINYTGSANSRAYQVSLQQNYRYEYNMAYNYGIFGKQYTFGIMACITTIPVNNNIPGSPISQYEPFEEFNKFSYLTSENSLIMPNESVKFESYVNSLRTDFSLSSQIHSRTNWYFRPGLYAYSAIAIFDTDRRIVGQYKNINSYNIENNGILLHINNINQFDSNLILRLYRYGGESLSIQKLYYVDIPICGGPYLYDNGVTVNGYFWHEANSELDNDLFYNRNCNKDIESISFTGKTVTCRGESKPLYGIWLKGDTVFNISTASNASMWIYDGTKWIER